MDIRFDEGKKKGQSPTTRMNMPNRSDSEREEEPRQRRSSRERRTLSARTVRSDPVMRRLASVKDLDFIEGLL